MKCAVLIPVGPGHEIMIDRVGESVNEAWKHGAGPFSGLDCHFFDDTKGKVGRAGARNRLLDESPADWFFFLDADDEMMPDAFDLVDLSYSATFGAVYLTDHVSKQNVWPCTRETLFEKGAQGTLSMGCFVRGDLGLRFDESLDVGEDFDFYMRLPDFTKIKKPLVRIGYDQPSAAGPRGYDSCRWIETCNAIIERYRDG